MSALQNSMKAEKSCVVLGVTGGIAAYKACEILRLLQRNNADVWVVMTKNATQFVSALTFETLSGHPTAVDTFSHDSPWEVEHIALAKRADVFLIAPATANIIAKLASGIADDMLSTTALATKAPIVLAPAMNTGMLENAATQANIALLRSRGVSFVESETGRLACGDVGAGKLADPEVIAGKVLSLLRKEKDLQGLKIAVTAGPTRELIDPVRYISNRSSGKMGYAIARAAKERGAEVTLLSGPVSIEPPAGVKVVRFSSTVEMLEAALEAVPEQDMIIQAAAPADFRAETIASQKIKKDGSGVMQIRLIENPDVAATLGRNKKPGQVFAGFAAETQNVEANAAVKLRKKNLDLIIANDVTKPGAGFDVETNIVTMIDASGKIELPQMPKREVAEKILDRMLALYRQKNS